MPVHPALQPFLDAPRKPPPPPADPANPKRGSRCAYGGGDLLRPRRRRTRSRCTRSTTSSPTAPTARSRSAGTSRPMNRGLPAVVFFHGGGFVCGNVACYDGLVRRIAKESRRGGLQRRLPAGARAPVPDPARRLPRRGRSGSWQTRTSWASTARRVAVAGDSAGGNLSAADRAAGPNRRARRCAPRCSSTR